jgi:sigma-B regulation protein RsbU (phosphoserine phosphatase)
VGRLTLWLLELYALSLVVGAGLGVLRTTCSIVDLCCTLALFPLLVILFFRWFTRRFLWKVRNRLILTYLLMGLAPVVLFATLAGIAGYLIAGQYATNSALTELDRAAVEVQDEAASESAFSAPAQARSEAEGAKKKHAEVVPVSRISLAELRGGTWTTLLKSASDADVVGDPLASQALPAWVKPGFRGVVELKERLYLCALVRVPGGDGSTVALGSIAVNAKTLGDMAKDLGRIRLVEGFSSWETPNVNDSGTGTNLAFENKSGEKITYKINDTSGNNNKSNGRSSGDESFATVVGGALAPRQRLLDVPVVFSAPVTIHAWQSGNELRSLMLVMSRPTLLYARLFANSANAGVVVKVMLLSIAIVFGVIELIALLMAGGLSRTITRSVKELYHGTREVDAGHLEHRIRVRRNDQLGSLAKSFNSMAASVSDLLQQQREKERLLNELAIAQEVQTNLFPHSPATVGALEMHAVCVPARTVGGDYYDFIFGHGSTLCLALGDISGKGISAALLMASLHSAVRAFLLNANAQPSPARMLQMINQHLYQSTQVERYATLFLACYDGATRRLTYSNGGHLPPMVLSNDGTLRALDCGGPVVGLLSGLEYEEATVELEHGDLLMAFSDGLTEPENDGDEFGAERLLECVTKNRERPLPVLAAGVIREVQAWIGKNEQPDDMTLLLARLL